MQSKGRVGCRTHLGADGFHGGKSSGDGITWWVPLNTPPGAHFLCVYSRCQKYVPFTAIALRWQGVSLFESGQFPFPLVGGNMH
jgi:hypothetical protein